MMFCKHKWEILSETITESAAEHHLKVAGPSKFHGDNLFGRKHIQVITCEKCGEFKRFVEEI